MQSKNCRFSASISKPAGAAIAAYKCRDSAPPSATAEGVHAELARRRFR